MIDIDIIRKKRTQGGTTTVSVGTGGTTGTTSSGALTVAGSVDRAKKADEADHAQRADNATHADSAKELDGNSSVWQKLRDTVGALDDVYLSKTSDDTAQGVITFVQGLVAKAVAKLEKGLVTGGDVKSGDYDNTAETGFSIEKDASGRYQAFLTNLTVWGKALFNELEIRKLSYSGGDIYLSGAGSKIIKTVPVRKVTTTDGTISTVAWEACEVTDSDCAGWKCYLLADDGTTATMNYWQEGDQVRCKTMGEITSAGTYDNAANRSYWRTIPDDGVSTANEKIYGTKTETYTDDDGNEQTRETQVELYDGQMFAWIVIGKHSVAFDGVTEGDTSTSDLQDLPQAGDTIVLDGNRHRSGTTQEYDKKDRQNLITLETTGTNAPRIACFANITEYKHTVTKDGEEKSLAVFETSPSGGTKINSSRFEWVSDDGSTVNIINYRGDWAEGTTYHKNDQVSHDNAVWVCVADSGVDVTEEPSDTATAWKKVLSGGKGDKGDAAVTYGVQMLPCQVYEGTGYQDGIQLQFTKAVGAAISTYTNVTTIGCTVKVLVDGVEDSDASDYINRGNDKMIYSHYTGLDTASVIAVNMYLDGVLVATANLSNGKQGKGALEISVNPDTVVFDTDDNGLVASGTSKTAEITCTRDGVDVTSKCTMYVDSKLNCTTATMSSNVVTIGGITSQTVSGVTVSNTSGYVRVKVSDPTDGTTHVVTVKFAVNVAKFTGGFAADNKKLKSQYSELTNEGAITSLTEYKSEILQTAREISLTVSEKKAGRRNLLVGSAFRKQGEGCLFMGSVISINTGYEGVNSIRAEDTYTGTTHYYGAFWDGSQGGSSVKITRGKKYTLSVWVKCSDSRAIICLETIYTDGQTGANRGTRPKTGTYEFSVDAVNTWQLLKVTIDTSLQADGTQNTQYDYMAVNIFSRHTVSGVTVHTHICRPMLEEGDTYNGWTLSEQDYDYVGGNLLDNAGALTKSGNVETLNGTVTQGGMGESASIKGTLPATTEYVDFLQYSTSGMGLKAGEDYVLSFYAKASSEAMAGKVRCYLYPSNGHINVEDSDSGNENTYQITDGAIMYGIVAGTAWKRYWVHWRPTVNDPQYVLFRLLPRGEVKGAYSSTTTYAVDEVVTYDSTYWRCVKAGKGNTPSSSSSYWEATTYDVSIAQPKLEVGATMTEWTEKRSDMVDKTALLATGIDIASKKITLTANNTKFQDNDGNELAVIDTEGLRASKIATTDNGSGHTVMSGNTTVWYQKDGKTPGIAVFYDAAGVPHFQFYGTDGSVKYDFGPSGLQSFINSTQSAYSDECYLHNASSYVSTSGDTITGMDWCYVAKNASADLCYIYRKQIPTTDESSASAIYDGCVFKGRKYSGTYWPSSDTNVGNYLLPNGWYVLPNDGNLPTKLHLADEEAVYDPTDTVYYQDFYYYSSGKVTRHVKAYMKKVSNTLASKFMSTGEWDEV